MAAFERSNFATGGIRTGEAPTFLTPPPLTVVRHPLSCHGLFFLGSSELTRLHSLTTLYRIVRHRGNTELCFWLPSREIFARPAPSRRDKQPPWRVGDRSDISTFNDWKTKCQSFQAATARTSEGRNGYGTSISRLPFWDHCCALAGYPRPKAGPTRDRCCGCQ